MKYKAVIFDLDGTILDTLEDLAASVNYALKTCGFPLRTTEEIRRFLGNGLVRLMEDSAPAGTDEGQRNHLMEVFNRHYEVHCEDMTRPYEGMEDALRQLQKAGVKTAVVSNKPDYAVQILAGRMFAGLFDYVTGVKEGVRRKPAPDSAESALQELAVEKKDAVYIGDSEVDIETAKNAGIDCISVEWGFRDRESLERAGASRIVSSAEELMQALW